MDEKKDKTLIIGLIALVAVVIAGFFLIKGCSKKEFSVTFDSNGGSVIENQSIEKNGKISRPANPTRDGYTFLGWFTSEDATTAFDFSKEITEDMKLIAKWSKNDDTCNLTCGEGYELDSENCECIETNDDDNTTVTSLKLSRSNVSLTVGQYITVVATVEPSSASVKWRTSNSDVATVSNGKITAVGAGTATITATAGGKSATVKVTVKNATTTNPGGTSNPNQGETNKPITGIKLDRNAATINVNGTVTLKATLEPSNNTDQATIKWTSSNPNVATVDNGKITGLSAGTTQITATVKASDGKEYTASATITVQSSYVVTLTRTNIGTADQSMCSYQYTMTVSKDGRTLENGEYTKITGAFTWKKEYNSNLIPTTSVNESLNTVTITLADGSTVNASVTIVKNC